MCPRPVRGRCGAWGRLAQVVGGRGRPEETESARLPERGGSGLSDRGGFVFWNLLSRASYFGKRGIRVLKRLLLKMLGAGGSLKVAEVEDATSELVGDGSHGHVLARCSAFLSRSCVRAASPPLPDLQIAAYTGTCRLPVCFDPHVGDCGSGQALGWSGDRSQAPAAVFPPDSSVPFALKPDPVALAGE